MTATPEDSTAAALRMLAADVESIGRRLELIRGDVASARESAAGAHRTLAQLAQQIAQLAAAGLSPGPDPGDGDGDAEVARPPWLVGEDPDVARADLADLVDWLRAVYVHYRGGELAACWLWHPGVVAELLALRDGWAAAHYGERASASACLDWHDRYRPGVVARVDRELHDCQLARHAPGGDRPYRPGRLRGVELADAIAEWWATTHGAGGAPQPAPTPDMLADARTEFTASVETF